MFHNCCIISGRTAYIGLGFGDRSDSFDLNVALQDHFKWLRKEQEGEQAPPQNLDLGFKEGETIKINMKITVSTLNVWFYMCRKSRYNNKGQLSQPC